MTPPLVQQRRGQLISQNITIQKEYITKCWGCQHHKGDTLVAKTFENPIFLILFILGVTILGIVIDQWKSRQWGQKKSPSQGARPIEATSMTGNDSKLRYSKCKLMTEHEKACYDRLKPVTDKLQLEIFTKVRLLDLFEPNEDRIDSKTLFYKVSQKHIDFVIWDSKHNSVVLLLEISDYSHSPPIGAIEMVL